MPPYRKPNIDEIYQKYGAQIEKQIKTSETEKINWSRQYQQFKKERAPELNNYERWCKSLGNFIKLNVSEKDKERINRSLKIAHLDVEPSQPLALAFMSFFTILFLGLLISVASYLILENPDTGNIALFFFLTLILGVFIYYFMSKYPERLANKWRLKASSQMVPAILYIVVYMRHTPNLEKAVAFASEHLQPPLALDFKKIFYDVEVGRFSTIKESIDNYLKVWRDYSIEFIESFHLIENSLFEPSKERRISTLDKALQVVLDGVYENMLKFTHNVRSPLTNVYMLGVVLPTLGLALLPLASAMIGDYLKAHHIFILFTLIVPFMVFYLTDKIMFLRPGGYGETTFLEKNPMYPLYKSKKPYVIAFILCLPFFILGLLPLIFQYTPLPEFLGLQKDYSFVELGLGFLGESKIFDFVQVGGGVVGPYGIGALLLSLFIPLGVALFFSLAFNQKTRELIIERQNTKQLEKEFNNSLFQLGNRMANGIPAELVFAKVAESSKGLKAEDFFQRVNYNIRQMGMSVENAIFNPTRGAIIFYPSDLIATSMKILIESSKKGLDIASSSLMSISEYLKYIQKITQRLKDMLAEIVSDMKSNMTFLAPLLSGIVVGLAAMITSILGFLEFGELGGGADIVGVGGFGSFLEIFSRLKMIPPYYLQIIIGIYLIQVIFILTRTLVTIDSGEDKLEKTNKTGKNLKVGLLLYFITAFISIITLFFLVTIVLGSL